MKDYSILSAQEKDALVQQAYDAGFRYENTYSNCAQCCLAGLSDVFPDMGIDDKLFKSAFALGGGVGQSTLGTCGALSGAAMAISVILGRERSNMTEIPQICFDLAYKVYEQFTAKYGGPRCRDVQLTLFNRCHEFRKPGELDAYLAADGHGRCGTAVGTAAALVARLIVDGELRPDAV